ALKASVSSGFFAATLNTAELSKGQQSINDGLSRVAQIETILGKIGTLAATAKAMADGTDRTALETQFTDLKSQLRSAIETTGMAGLDNFLNNAPDTSYEIINGKNVQVKGGFDLKTMIADVMDTQSLSTAAAASALEIKAIQVTTYTDRAKVSLNASKPILDNVVSQFDPRGKLDSQIYEMKSGLSALVAGAAKDKLNLLSADQKDIKLNSLSSGTVLTFRAQSGFAGDFSAALDNVLAQLGNGSNAILDKLDDVVSIANSAKQKLESDNRFATLEYGKLGGTIDVLDPANTTAASDLYKTNAFTTKFIARYLTQTTMDNAGSNNGATSYATALFGVSDTTSSIANIMSLAVSLKA
ncbi:MAG: hypothetical protein JWM96_793, partial [Alphaproteobacteria bacterium]|nr:hypothetical protein [Alphaproteobacteria bacterium]